MLNQPSRAKQTGLLRSCMLLLFLLGLGCILFSGIKVFTVQTGLEFCSAGYGLLSLSLLCLPSKSVKPLSQAEIRTRFVNKLLFNKWERVSINLSELVRVFFGYAWFYEQLYIILMLSILKKSTSIKCISNCFLKRTTRKKEGGLVRTSHSSSQRFA